VLNHSFRRARRALRIGAIGPQHVAIKATLATLMFMLGAVCVRGGATATRPHAQGLLPLPDIGNDSTHYKVVVVAQLADCNGNLGHFAALDRPSLRPLLRSRHLLIDGAARDTIGIRRRLPRGLASASLALLTKAQRSLLQSLGHTATPILALYDQRNRLLLISATPAGPIERTTFIRAVTRLVNNDPSL